MFSYKRVTWKGREKSQMGRLTVNRSSLVLGKVLDNSLLDFNKAWREGGDTVGLLSLAGARKHSWRENHNV